MKMPHPSIDIDVANSFMKGLIKSLQGLCHSLMDFDSGVEVIGYINVNIDDGSTVDFVLNEKVSKGTPNSLNFISSSYHSLSKKDGSENNSGENSHPTLQQETCSARSNMQQQCHPQQSEDHYSRISVSQRCRKSAHCDMEKDPDESHVRSELKSSLQQSPVYSKTPSQVQPSVPPLSALPEPTVLKEEFPYSSDIGVAHESSTNANSKDSYIRELSEVFESYQNLYRHRGQQDISQTSVSSQDIETDCTDLESNKTNHAESEASNFETGRTDTVSNISDHAESEASNYETGRTDTVSNKTEHAESEASNVEAWDHSDTHSVSDVQFCPKIEFSWSLAENSMACNPSSNFTDSLASNFADKPASNLADNPSSNFYDNPLSSFTDNPSSSFADNPSSGLVYPPSLKPVYTTRKNKSVSSLVQKPSSNLIDKPTIEVSGTSEEITKKVPPENSERTSRFRERVKKYTERYAEYKRRAMEDRIFKESLSRAKETKYEYNKKELFEKMRNDPEHYAEYKRRAMEDRIFKESLSRAKGTKYEYNKKELFEKIRNDPEHYAAFKREQKRRQNKEYYRWSSAKEKNRNLPQTKSKRETRRECSMRHRENIKKDLESLAEYRRSERRRTLLKEQKAYQTEHAGIHSKKETYVNTVESEIDNKFAPVDLLEEEEEEQEIIIPKVPQRETTPLPARISIVRKAKDKGIEKIKRQRRYSDSDSSEVEAISLNKSGLKNDGFDYDTYKHPVWSPMDTDLLPAQEYDKKQKRSRAAKSTAISKKRQRPFLNHKAGFSDRKTTSKLENPSSSFAESPLSSFADNPSSSFADNPSSSFADNPTSSFSVNPSSSFADNPLSSFADNPSSGLIDTPSQKSVNTTRNNKPSSSLAIKSSLTLVDKPSAPRDVLVTRCVEISDNVLMQCEEIVCQCVNLGRKMPLNDDEVNESYSGNVTTDVVKRNDSNRQESHSGNFTTDVVKRNDSNRQKSHSGNVTTELVKRNDNNIQESNSGNVTIDLDEILNVCYYHFDSNRHSKTSVIVSQGKQVSRGASSQTSKGKDVFYSYI